MSKFDPRSIDLTGGAELVGTPATVWMRRAATAERLAGGLNSRKDSELLASYVEECHAHASRALTRPTASERLSPASL